MKILYAASEAQPVAASGGLADVAGSLPKALVEEGHEACVVVRETVLPENNNICGDGNCEAGERRLQSILPGGNCWNA